MDYYAIGQRIRKYRKAKGLSQEQLAEMVDISTTLNTVNKLTPDKKTELQAIIEDTKETTCNLRKFSEKLNKRFLLWRLMF